MGAIFVVLGRSGAIDAAARAFPRPLIRGVQLTVGLIFLRIAWGLVDHPPAAFDDHGLGRTFLIATGVGVLTLLLLRRRVPVTLLLLAVAALVIGTTAADSARFGPSSLTVPALDATTFWTALTVLVLPQVPLSFANSCLATADAARTYFGDRAARVQPGRLATTFGLANLAAGAVGGMPVCHGAGGLTAHYSNGARTAGAPLAIGATLVAVALVIGAGLGGLLAAFPLPILAGLLAGAGLLHIGLLRDLRDPRSLAFAACLGTVGFAVNLAVALALGLAAWWGTAALRALVARRRGRLARRT
jgi:MFS superfamily sulfate permease-like transporter